MGFLSKDIETLDDLFVHTLRDIYYAEKQIVEALPKMIEKATAPELKGGVQQHLEQTKGHVQRVEEVFEMLGVKAKEVDCPAIDGILEEADDVSGDIDDKQVLDAALIASAQAVEHYVITRYGTLIAWAKQLGRSDCVGVLDENLKEEVATDKKLTEMAESGQPSGTCQDDAKARRSIRQASCGRSRSTPSTKNSLTGYRFRLTSLWRGCGPLHSDECLISPEARRRDVGLGADRVE